MGTDTLRLQTALKREGFDPGPLDGKRGKKTNAALAAWSDMADDQVKGIDVSHYQTSIDWPKVFQSGVRFVAVRSSVSVYQDKLFLQHWAGAKNAGILRAAYHFFAPWKDPVQQAHIVVSRLEQNPGELPVVLDVEAVAAASKEGAPTPVPVTTKQLIDRTKVCLDELEKLTKRIPIFYTYSAFARQYGLGAIFGKKYKLWLADYREGPPTAPPDWPWLIHQYAGNGGRQVGVKGPCDLNRLKASLSFLQSL